MLNNIGTTEIVIFAIILLVIFGPKKLPEFAKGLSEAVKEILNAFKGDSHDKKKND